MKEELVKTLSPTDSIVVLANKLVSNVTEVMRTAKSEEDLKMGFEKLLDPIKTKLNIKSLPQYEKTIFDSGRSDALHGQLVIEYEKPRSFRAQTNINHSVEQLITYIIGELPQIENKLFPFKIRTIGVGFDGEAIFFVQYRGDQNKIKCELTSKDFFVSGPYPFNIQSARTFLAHLRALDRISLNADNLSSRFGPKSAIASQAVSAFYDAFQNWKNPRVDVYFSE